MWFKFTPFHQRPEWTALARRHKRVSKSKDKLYCVDCGAVEGLQSDHILPRSKYPKLALNISNLCIRCGPCNQKKGASVKVDSQTLRIALRVIIIRLLKLFLVGCGCYAVTTPLAVKIFDFIILFLQRLF